MLCNRDESVRPLRVRVYVCVCACVRALSCCTSYKWSVYVCRVWPRILEECTSAPRPEEKKNATRWLIIKRTNIDDTIRRDQFVESQSLFLSQSLVIACNTNGTFVISQSDTYLRSSYLLIAVPLSFSLFASLRHVRSIGPRNYGFHEVANVGELLK